MKKQSVVEQLQLEKKRAKDARTGNQQSVDVATSPSGWHKKQLTQRQWRTFVVLLFFVLCGVFASYMYVKTNGEYEVERVEWLDLFFEQS